jgi:hypothetical protein
LPDAHFHFIQNVVYLQCSLCKISWAQTCSAKSAQSFVTPPSIITTGGIALKTIGVSCSARQTKESERQIVADDEPAMKFQSKNPTVQGHSFNACMWKFWKNLPILLHCRSIPLTPVLEPKWNN